MKGVVLAGGLGTRFDPVTRVVNKHLLDVFDEPMIYHPIRALVRAGLSDLVLVTGAELGQFKDLIGDGSELGATISYAQQSGERGIADALAKARPFVGEDKMVVILGDNIFQDDLSPYVAAFAKQPHGAKLLLKRVGLDDAARFGVAVFEGDKLCGVVEKPTTPISDLVITGCYMYDADVFSIIEGLVPSARNELEITDVNNEYIRRGAASYDVVPGYWTDAGTPASKLKASILVALGKGVTFHA